MSFLAATICVRRLTEAKKFEHNHHRRKCSTSEESSLVATSSSLAINAELQLEFKGRRSEAALATAGRAHLTVHGQLAAAIRRTVCKVSAASFGMSAMTDVCRHAVVRSEIVLSACIVGSFKSFHKRNDAELSNGSFGIACHSLSSDA